MIINPKELQEITDLVYLWLRMYFSFLQIVETPLLNLKNLL